MRGPAWAEWVLRRAAGGAEADWVLAELEAEHAVRVEREGERAAARWYVGQVVRSMLPLAMRRWELHGRERSRGTMGELVRDVRYAVRNWLRTPVFTALAVSMLALGMGGTLAVFAVVNGVLLAPLGYPGWQRLVHVEGSSGALHGVSLPVIEELRAASQTVDDLVAWQGWGLVLRDAENVPVRRSAASVSANFFEVLGTRPALGRLFGPEDDPAGHAPVVVLSHALWQSVYGGDRDVVGRPLRVDSAVYTIVGVAPEGFSDPVAAGIPTTQPALWRASPPVFAEAADDWGWIGFWAIGRLRPGATTEVASAEVRRLIRATLPEADSDPQLAVTTFRERQVREIRPTLVLLFAAVAGVLLIACANLANLLLSRASGRAREVAVRASLGARRGRLVAQLMTETLVLCLCGGLTGLVVARVGGGAIVRLAGGELPPGSDIVMDVRVVAFALGLSVLCAVAAGLVPALRLTESRLAETLRDAGRSALATRRGQRFRYGLVIAQTALAVVLLSGAGLLLRTAWNLLHTDPGFEPGQVLTMRLAMYGGEFATPATQDNALENALAQVRALPDVRAAAAINDLPMSGAVNSTPVRSSERPDDAGVQTLVRTITPDFFDVLAIDVLRGRRFTAADGRGAPDVAVINRTLATRLLGGGDPIGRTVIVRGQTREIVGVVEDVTEFSLAGGSSDPVLYSPYPQELQTWMRENVTAVVRTVGEPAALADAVRTTVRRAEPMMSIDAIRPMRSYIERDTAAPRFRALLVGVFAALALAIAAAGTGGLSAYTVSRRLPEMGLRMALGATRGEIIAMVIRHAGRLTLAGIIAGLLGALATMRLVAGFLVDVPTTDVFVLATSALLLALVGVGSAWLPALRAARTDPAKTLRAD